MYARKKSEWILTVLWSLILCVYWLSIAHINFSQNPSFYCTDMYSDMIYASEAWYQQDLFPDGWVFGNQLYVVATPVLAALCFGITHNHCIAMGLASTLMGIGVVLSFSWMIKPILNHLHERLAAIVLFMSIVLLCGDAVYHVNGWQLFFTMCSYYACYAITAFLAFGCFLRGNTAWSLRVYLIFMIACLLSFGTGIQSLRQTAVMILPLLAVAFLEWLYCILTKKILVKKRLWVVCLLCVANLTGVLFANVIPVEKNEIFGSVSFFITQDFMANAISSVIQAFGLFADYRAFALILFFAACIYIIFSIFQHNDLRDNHLFLLLFLCLVSVAVILVMDILTTMHIRHIYYFLLFPMFAVQLAYLYSHNRILRYLLTAGMLMLSFLCWRQDLDTYLKPPENPHALETVSSYLEENNITTVYSNWNLGEKIAIASDFKIKVGFWDAPSDVFRPVKYLCNPSVFHADPSDCAYIVSGEETLSLAIEKARSRNADIHVDNYFPELNLYVFSSDSNLMN